MVKTIGRLTFVGLALTFGAAPALAADGYAVTDLGTPEGKANSWVWQQSVNESGLVAAYANDIENPNAFYGAIPFLWNRGRVTVLPELEGAIATIPFSLNDRGQVVGSSRPAGRGPRAVRWDWHYGPRTVRQGDGPEAGCHDRRVSWRIETLGELPGDGFSEALAIDNHDKAAGYSGIVISFDPFVVEYHAALWHKGQVFPLPPLPGGGKADIATDVNDADRSSGSRGRSSVSSTRLSGTGAP